MSFLSWLGLTAAREPLAVGDAAPDVVSRDENDREVRLADLYQDGITMIYFYPKADTPGCTAQGCSLRDNFTELQAHGVRIIGVSTDRPHAQLLFKEKFRLPFMLLADYDYAVTNAFGVRLVLGMAQRQAFLIKNGKIVWRDLHASTREQSRDIFKALKTLS